MPRPPVDIPEQRIGKNDKRGIVQAIHELSLVPTHRAFRDVKTKSSNYTMDEIFDRIILCSAEITITLPPAADADHVVYTIVRTGASTVTVSASDNINGSGSDITIGTIYQSVSVASDGTDWFRVDTNS